MSRLQWILAGTALAFWIPSYVWFFHNDVRNWLRGRGAARHAAGQQRKEAAEANTRRLDELAAKYLQPPFT